MSGVDRWMEALFDEGQSAYDQGTPRDECPYRTHTREAHEWRAGWNHREDECYKAARAKRKAA